MSQHKVERSDSIVVAALYKFVRLGDFEQLREPLLALMLAQDVRGTLLLAGEGINGTISGPRSGIDTVLGWLREDPRLADLEYKESLHDEHPFLRTKVKLKKEIVTMGVEGIDPNRTGGTYLGPEEWNAVISDPETLLIDTRNDYEVEVGTFKGAINPETRTFREFPDYVKDTLDPAKHKKVAMFCTGGSRGEKASSCMPAHGFENVYHLKGGILKYLEAIPADESKWKGECFVFDQRVSVKHGLEEGEWKVCHACREPLSREDTDRPEYEKIGRAHV